MTGWCEKLYDTIEPLDPYLEDRFLIVSGLYIFSFLVLDVPTWKACAVTLLVYFCLLTAIGGRTLAFLCVPLSAVAIARWTNIAGINELAETARHSLVHLALH